MEEITEHQHIFNRDSMLHGCFLTIDELFRSKDAELQLKCQRLAELEHEVCFFASIFINLLFKYI